MNRIDYFFGFGLLPEEAQEKDPEPEQKREELESEEEYLASLSGK